jgi:hypothetical protein
MRWYGRTLAANSVGGTGWESKLAQHREVPIGKHERTSDVHTAAVDSLKELDPDWSIK